MKLYNLLAVKKYMCLLMKNCTYVSYYVAGTEPLMFCVQHMLTGHRERDQMHKGFSD